MPGVPLSPHGEGCLAGLLVADAFLPGPPPRVRGGCGARLRGRGHNTPQSLWRLGGGDRAHPTAVAGRRRSQTLTEEVIDALQTTMTSEALTSMRQDAAAATGQDPAAATRPEPGGR